jgi:hypothetical protein
VATIGIDLSDWEDHLPTDFVSAEFKHIVAPGPF